MNHIMKNINTYINKCFKFIFKTSILLIYFIFISLQLIYFFEYGYGNLMDNTIFDLINKYLLMFVPVISFFSMIICSIILLSYFICLNKLLKSKNDKNLLRFSTIISIILPILLMDILITLKHIVQ